MKVDQVVKVDDKLVHFRGELTQDEADVVLGLGLNHLMRMGVLTKVFAEGDGLGVEDDGVGFAIDPSDTVQ